MPPADGSFRSRLPSDRDHSPGFRGEDDSSARARRDGDAPVPEPGTAPAESMRRLVTGLLVPDDGRQRDLGLHEGSRSPAQLPSLAVDCDALGQILVFGDTDTRPLAMGSPAVMVPVNRTLKPAFRISSFGTIELAASRAALFMAPSMTEA